MAISSRIKTVLSLLILANLSKTTHSKREHKVHNIVLYPEKYSWCQLTPIQQIISTPGYESITIENNICVGACYSYSIPKTHPADPGEILGPYCDSCQVSSNNLYHVTVNSDDSIPDTPKTTKKTVQIITGCSCKTCGENSLNDNDLSIAATVELPLELYIIKNDTKNNKNDNYEVPELIQLNQNNRNNITSFDIVNFDSPKYDITSKTMALLKKIQTSELDDADYDDVKALIKKIQDAHENKITDKSLMNFVNYINIQNNVDFELDVIKLKDVLESFERKNEVLERQNDFWVQKQLLANAKINDDVEKFEKKTGIEFIGQEGHRLGIPAHHKGSHLAMGIHTKQENSSKSTTDNISTASFQENTTPTPNFESSTATDSFMEIATEKKLEISETGHHHHLGEEQTIVVNGQKVGAHLVKGPHGSMVLTPDPIKIEEKLSLPTEDLTPNHQGVVISYGSSKPGSQSEQTLNE